MNSEWPLPTAASLRISTPYFLMPDEQLTFISASIVKEIAYWGGDLTSFVPENVAEALIRKFSDQQEQDS
jgi:pantetheine-phosphate adenylyltransferase